MRTIPFNRTVYLPKCKNYVYDVILSHKLCGDGAYTMKCNKWLEGTLHVEKALLTTSCTHAIEIAAILANISAGDEVIMPSFTFVSTADAFVLRGAKIIFVDIRPDTMNIDETLIEEAITDNTKAIVPVHYAGVPCEMDTIMDIAKKYNLTVIEDAAQAIGSKYNNRACGTFGEYGCLSFHETKNLTMGEGGSLLIRDRKNVERAEVIREKGTNRSRFFRGEIDKYTWVDVGSSYLPSELNAAYLYAQMECFDDIEAARLRTWNAYYSGFEKLEMRGQIERPKVPDHCEHNGHMFYIKAHDIKERNELIAYLQSQGIGAVFHYIPLHTSPGGIRFGRFQGTDRFTTKESQRLVRLPLYYDIGDDIYQVIENVEKFYERKQ